MKYVDADGNELATSATLNGKIDAPYQTSAKSISDWAVKTTPNNATGVFTKRRQTLTSAPEPASAASDAYKSQDADGNELATSDTLNGKIDAPYQTSDKSISDWAVKPTPNNATGVFTNSKQSVKYVYEKADVPPVTLK